MKIELLPKEMNQYKANLHSHTVLSDGCVTPEVMKDAYKAQGYSILAFTDHNIFIPHNDLTDEDFLILNGIEYDVNAKGGKTCHFCAIAGSKDEENQLFFHREPRYVWKGGLEAIKQVKFDDSLPDYVRTYSAEGISEMMRGCRDKGYFVTYNHPCWSLERYPDYMSYDGFHAMEIMNSGSIFPGYPEYNEQVYDDMLVGGKRVLCSATDDNHSVVGEAFCCFNYVAAEKLTYESVMEALFAGRFYASNGPRITALWVEDGTFHIEVPGAREIRVFTGTRRAARALGTPDAPVTEFSYKPDASCPYVRFTVTDFEGNVAHTQAYFPDELGLDFKEEI